MPSSISCIATGVQHGNVRFPPLLTEAPFIKPYRSNLTALSHEYNHFYYASKDTIIVCEPGFPDQKFSNAPALTLYPPVSAPNLTFYMDRITPHSINQLHVDYLGKEEILLAVCDDGDIIGYRTTAIQAALQMKATKREDNWNPQPRTILHRNVGKSAWGLAVHREARLVAISANNHLITIIAFALTAPPTAEEQIPHNSRTSFRPHGDFPRDRTKDDVFTVTANSNIPSVAFDNTGDDPSGRWLFGSDIQGMTHLYDLHHRHTTSQKIHVGRCIEASNPREDPGPAIHHGGCLCGDTVMHAHWGAMFIDPRSFQHYDSYTDAFGVIPSPEEPCYWNVTSAKRSRRSSVNAPLGNDNSDADSDFVEPSGTENLQEATSDTIEDSMDTDVEEETHSAVDIISQSGIVEPGNEDLPSAQNDSDLESNTSSDDDALFTVPYGWQSWSNSMGARRRRARKSYCQITGLGNLFLFKETPSSPPCVIISKEEIYLLQSSYGAHALLDFSPIVTMHNPLYHETECYDEKDPWTQRHNLFAQIPELGIFIVGANTGRCAVYSFTRVKTKALPTESEHIIYGFRQDFILPFDQQETRGHAVPKHEFLAGIAVGPVQGSLNSERTVDNGASVNRRWRIILLFSEHTVLSYEVGRKCEPGALELGDLMV